MVFGDMFLTLEDPPVIDSIFVFFQNSFVEVLDLNVVVLGCEASER